MDHAAKKLTVAHATRLQDNGLRKHTDDIGNPDVEIVDGGRKSLHVVRSQGDPHRSGHGYFWFEARAPSNDAGTGVVRTVEQLCSIAFEVLSSVCSIALLLSQKLVSAAGISAIAREPPPEGLGGKEFEDVWRTRGALVGGAKPYIIDRLPFGADLVGTQRSCCAV